MQNASVDCNRIDKKTEETDHIWLYNNVCEIGYTLPDNIEIAEKGE